LAPPAILEEDPVVARAVSGCRVHDPPCLPWF
jgi:hypothetical protein